MTDVRRKAKRADVKAASLSAVAQIVGGHATKLSDHSQSIKELRASLAEERRAREKADERLKHQHSRFREEQQLWMADVNAQVGEIKVATSSASVNFAQARIDMEKAAERFDEAVLELARLTDALPAETGPDGRES